MRMILRDMQRRRVGRVNVDAAARPTRTPIEGTDREFFPHWDGAIDDAGCLRSCLSCECKDLFREKAFPQITGFVLVLAFAGAFVGVFGAFGSLGVKITTPVLIGMSAVLLLDVAILLFSRTRLVCYRCHSSYRDLPMARYHRNWDRTTAVRYPAPEQTPEPVSDHDEEKQDATHD